MHASSHLKTLPIQLADGNAYNIYIGQHLLTAIGSYLKKLFAPQKCIIVTDTHVAPLYLKTVVSALEAYSFTPHNVIIQAGEASKSLAHYREVVDSILACGITRQTPILALGGGVVGDLTGFVAATLLRGVPFIQIPTTLLAQVDSSVGGKTGINTAYGKNLLGAFYQPRCVLSDVGALQTLPLRERQAGYAEIFKCALIGDRNLFAWCGDHAKALIDGDPEALSHAINKACQFKAQIVAQDEKEKQPDGGRILLNLGHTFAHALESEMGYNNSLLHGEAVMIGIQLTLSLSRHLGLCPDDDYRRIWQQLEQLDMAISIKDLHKRLAVSDLISHMRRDKKNQGQHITFVLLRGIGRAFVDRRVPIKAVETILREDGAC